MLVSLWCVAGAAAMAQVSQPDSLHLHDDNADFTFSESQLNDDNDASQAVNSVVAKNDPYLRNVGYRFSPMRFRVRALDNLYNTN